MDLNNGVKHNKSAPYHSSTNDIVKWFVQSFKRAILTNENLLMDQKLTIFLLQLLKIIPMFILFKLTHFHIVINVHALMHLHTWIYLIYKD